MTNASNVVGPCHQLQACKTNSCISLQTFLERGSSPLMLQGGDRYSLNSGDVVRLGNVRCQVEFQTAAPQVQIHPLPACLTDHMLSSSETTQLTASLIVIELSWVLGSKSAVSICTTHSRSSWRVLLQMRMAFNFDFRERALQQRARGQGQCKKIHRYLR